MFTAMSDAAARQSAGGADTRQRVEKLLYEAVDEVNLGLAEGDRLQKSPDAVLAGDAGRLDSLGLINFIVAAEKRLQTEFQADLSLTDVITSQDPVRHLTLGSLCGTVTGMVERTRGGS